MAGESTNPVRIARHATSHPPWTDSRRKYTAKTSSPRRDHRQETDGDNIRLIQAAARTTGTPTIHEFPSRPFKPSQSSAIQKARTKPCRNRKAAETTGAQEAAAVMSRHGFGQRCHR